MRKVLTKEKAEKILAPHYERITSSIKKGFTDYLEMVGFDCYSKKRVLDFNPRTKATLINNLIAVRIQDSFAKDKGITAKEYNGVFGLNLKNQLFIRFKKFNTSLSPARSSSMQTLKIEKQQTVIPGFPRKPTFLYIGYTFNQELTGIANIYVALRLNGRNEWVMPLTIKEDVQKTQKVIAFTSVKKPGKRVTVKEIAKRKRQAAS